MTQLADAPTIFLSSLLEAIPLLLLGIIVSSLILVFIDADKLAGFFPRNPFLAALWGSCLGLVLPVFKYGNVPVARRLLLQGASAPVAMAFLVAAPIINPVTIYVTWVAFPTEPSLAILRLSFILAIACLIGYIFSAGVGKESPWKAMSSPLLLSGTFLQKQEVDTLPLGERNTLTFGSRLILFIDNIRQEFQELTVLLVLGTAIVTVVQVYLPREQILNLAQGPVREILAMFALGSVTAVSSTVDAFFIQFFTASFSNAALLAFLLFSSVLDLKVLPLLLAVFRPKVVFYLLLLCGLATFCLTLLLSFHVS